MRVGAKSLGKKIDLRDHAREITLLVSGEDRQEVEKEAAFLSAMYRVFVMGGKIEVTQDGKSYSFEQPAPQFDDPVEKEPADASSPA